MFTIVKKRLLAPNIYLMEVNAPRVAKSAQPGQFVIVRVREKGERIPLTIADFNRQDGAVTIVTQSIGASTKLICALQEGEALLDFAGPLGQPSELIHMTDEELANTRILFIGGGVGTAPVYPQVKYLSERGFKADVIIGAKNKDYVILEDEMRAVVNGYYLTTDDGSASFKGLVTDRLKDLIENQSKKYDLVVTIGPMIMMKFVTMLTKEYGIKTIASLNTLMVDGTGMCGACRVSIGGKTRFTCVDGPEFDAHLVDFDEAMRRQNMYRTIEGQKIAELELENHKCKIGL
ncbi:MAG: sulfide/dihydroorotate dehydrogenase-like FAD/NAD-binding protein [Bacteroidales bacterium]|jgi:ferredoxin--NADP+ reductase|nr:sulfide/dihydroorotate dehydrogenase-like FAD/NAD-binding protein [Bacteroidales bacterium]MDI9593168.1 sulfide/dihydroorotate dehydrogenase-like FAD/NAD-binding protein [Bacteroidota bacterium]OQC37470.1 MAG: Dihydroorotate dehydrogenase B (NAD(+)), electron transfer subunit [Bacteroidetes bacterium ADurb.Bin041]HOF81303.1 sulfide/dihydroorotate dehydrogenase-like FAD/NAD-binding protein [Bacteroidales bacterium]HOR76542.1 sulfide/dihydroorotate dehydrogenase-like FAD/NAD-binding protein [B